MNGGISGKRLVKIYINFKSRKNSKKNFLIGRALFYFMKFFKKFFKSTSMNWLNDISFPSRLSFIDADVACQRRGSGSNLSSILSLEENRNVFLASERRFLVGHNASTVSNFFWLGLTNEPFVRGKILHFPVKLFQK